jgi:hypothetical protein
MTNIEHPTHKTGLIGEGLVKMRLNEYGVNIGNVDKDTGTDIIMFFGDKKTNRSNQIRIEPLELY